MKHLSLNIFLSLVVTIATSILSFYLLYKGLWAQAVLSIITCIITVILLFSFIKRLSTLISIFLKGLLARDTTLRFDFSSHDPLIGDLAEDMNTIASIYHESNIQLETSKLYYDRILKIMTHEMRNYVAPVISITSDVEAHPENYSSIGDLKDIISVINSQSNGIRHFLDSYYQLTHLPTLNMKSIQATEFISYLIPFVNGELKSRNIDSSICQFEVPQNMEMKIDVTLMSQVLLNMIRNSLDAVSSIEDSSITVNVSISEGNPFITVTDNGAGISQNMINNIFQPFYTSKSDGCGVGLTISRQIIRKHGGDLKLLHASKPTVFAITLPSFNNS